MKGNQTEIVNAYLKHKRTALSNSVNTIMIQKVQEKFESATSYNSINTSVEV